MVVIKLLTQMQTSEQEYNDLTAKNRWPSNCTLATLCKAFCQ